MEGEASALNVLGRVYGTILNEITKGEHLRVTIKSDFGCTGVFVDIGCGWEEMDHLAVTDAVGIDLNIPQKPPRVEYPIVADAHYIPIREGSADFMNCQALLEHIPDPDKCMEDMSKTMKDNGRGFILIPVEANWPRNMMKRFLKEFPFSLFSVVRLLYRIRTLWKIPGMPHIRQITLDDVKRHFKIDKVGVHKKPHWYTWGRPWPVRGILMPLIPVGRITVDEFAVWHIWVSKK